MGESVNQRNTKIKESKRTELKRAGMGSTNLINEATEALSLWERVG
jgi:hypothetical protein